MVIQIQSLLRRESGFAINDMLEVLAVNHQTRILVENRACGKIFSKTLIPVN
tara:strand:- start:468 stop:623 length:156 start_codon:yes stop_codon:yes gene_type:complete